MRIDDTRVALALCAGLMAAACHGREHQPHREDAIRPRPEPERVRMEPREDGRGEPAADLAARGWPDGWMITVDEALLPVVDDVGRELSVARLALVEHRRKDAAAAVDRAANALAGEDPDEARRDGADPAVNEAVTEGAAYEIQTAVSRLRRLSRRLHGAERTSLAHFDRVATEAYQADLDYAWVDVSDEELSVFVSRPDEHLAAGRRLMRHERPDAAVRELKRAVALFRLELARIAPGDEANTIEGHLEQLDRYITTIGIAEGSLDGLEERIEPLESAFAEHYVHRARSDWEHGRRRDTGHAMIGLAAHLRRLEPEAATLRQEYEALVGTLEDEGRELARNHEPSSVTATLDRAEDRVMEADWREEHHARGA